MNKELLSTDLTDLDENDIYELFGVTGNEEAALNESYLELFRLLGKDAMLKIFRHYRGDKIDCPMKLFRADFVASIAENAADKRERGNIARAAGYALKFIEGIIQKRRKEERRSDTADK